jgi:hypothetical protein
LASALDGGEWSPSYNGRFTPRERAPFTRWIGGCVGPRAVLDAVVKRKIPSPPPEMEPQNPDHPVLFKRHYIIYFILKYKINTYLNMQFKKLEIKHISLFLKHSEL